MDNDLIIISAAVYIFLVATLAKLGAKREVGGKKAFLYSLILTPVTGLIVVANSSRKDLLNIVHYKCGRCGLEYTDYHRHCPNCKKDNIRIKLRRKTMHTY
ncbi:MAG: hypothetical protein K8R53_14650 [Bacteroidales bacterium]|nr:hypothetical protein [Bacteroidales bacterium]